MSADLKIPKIRIIPSALDKDLSTDTILHCALQARLDSAVVLGYDGNGEMFFSSNYSDAAEVLWLLRKAEQELMSLPGDEDL